MATEIERKFILSDPAAVALDRGRRVRQGYLAIDGAVEVRIRIVEGVATLTLKGGKGLARTEIERSLEPGEAEDLWPLTEGRRIEKTRHLVDLEAGHVAEVDVYDGDLAGLCVVEVELDDVDAADAFTPPDWFGREVTGEAGWSNAELAQHGRPRMSDGDPGSP